MVTYDNFKYPVKGMKEVKRLPNGYHDINPLYIEQARQLILQECSENEDLSEFLRAQDEIKNEAMFFPVTKSF